MEGEKFMRGEISQTKDRPARPQPKSNDPSARNFAVETARLLSDYHCEDVLIFDVSRLSEVTYYLVIASGTSDQQIKSLAHHASDLGKQLGFERYGTERNEASTWLVVDFVEVMVHMFEPVTRSHYDLEMLWGDAPRVPWERGDGQRVQGSGIRDQ